MKITIYDLLGMIKDGKTPKRIIYDEYVYVWNNKIENYERETNIGTSLNWDYIVINCLNEKVEILEEEKKIPEKIEREIYIDNGIEISSEPSISQIVDKFNQLIDYLKSKGK